MAGQRLSSASMAGQPMAGQRLSSAPANGCTCELARWQTGALHLESTLAAHIYAEDLERVLSKDFFGDKSGRRYNSSSATGTLRPSPRRWAASWASGRGGAGGAAAGRRCPVPAAGRGPPHSAGGRCAADGVRVAAAHASGAFRPAARSRQGGRRGAGGAGRRKVAPRAGARGAAKQSGAHF
jgi:hypothetical protein